MRDKLENLNIEKRRLENQLSQVKEEIRIEERANKETPNHRLADENRELKRICAVALKYDGETYADVAKIMGVSMTTVSGYLGKARKQLRFAEHEALKSPLADSTEEG